MCCGIILELLLGVLGFDIFWGFITAYEEDARPDARRITIGCAVLFAIFLIVAVLLRATL